MQLIIDKTVREKNIKDVIEEIKQIKNYIFDTKNELLNSVDNAFIGWTIGGNHNLRRNKGNEVSLAKFDYVYCLDYDNNEKSSNYAIKIDLKNGMYKLAGVFRID
ncbi:hypothetical protein [Clostridium pasteurianum]|uniref:Uncharacterized protein n=1 Tax=Clostridium pasteurianum BC1 TaxID=86416 RepID=R4K1H0_CLOPA|nr:hypothetical protein [Clostridium pasteurianum]AGK96413.1 hypothetical protein Clopa_1438 [Clostridium pasteurianum BC1]